MRLVSPHVSIYKFPITAISSITNRITGVFLSGLYIGSGIAVLTDQDKKVIECYKHIDSIKCPYNIGPSNIINYCIIFPTVYHVMGGIRHLMWDKYPNLLTNTKVHKSSILLFATTGVGSVFIENYLRKKVND